MKILIVICLLMISGSVFAQVDRITQSDSIKSTQQTTTFTVNSRHNYNTVQFDSLASTDSIKVWHINQKGKKYEVALRDLNTWTDLEGNLITGVAGRREYLILHPNLYIVEIEYANDSPTKTIKLERRGNNLK